MQENEVIKLNWKKEPRIVECRIEYGNYAGNKCGIILNGIGNRV